MLVCGALVAGGDPPGRMALMTECSTRTNRQNSLSTLTGIQPPIWLAQFPTARRGMTVRVWLSRPGCSEETKRCSAPRSHGTADAALLVGGSNAPYYRPRYLEAATSSCRNRRKFHGQPHQEAGYTSAVVTVAPNTVSLLQSSGVHILPHVTQSGSPRRNQRSLNFAVAIKTSSVSC